MGSFLYSVFQDKPSILIFKIFAANSSRLVSSPHGFTSHTIIDLATGAAFTFFSFSLAAFFFSSSFALVSSSLSSANGSKSSSYFLALIFSAGYCYFGPDAFFAFSGFD